MTTWHQYMQNNPTSPEWPYPIRYGKHQEIDTDVLVLGGVGIVALENAGEHTRGQHRRREAGAFLVGPVD